MATLTQSVRTIRTSNPGYYTYKCDVIENSYNIANNTSNVTITFSIQGPQTWGAAFYEWTTHYGIIVDGSIKTTSSSMPYVATSYVQLLTWTGDITHNADGSKSMSVSVYLYNGSKGYLPLQYTSSSPLSMGSVTLTTIPRKSSISFGEFTMDSAGTITINRASSSFTHTITYAFGSKSGTITTKTTETSVSWTPTVSDLAGQIPNAVRGQGTLTVTTYSGSTSVGSNSYTFYCNLPTSVVPTVGTITLTPQTYSYLIQNKNTVKVSVSGCSAGTGSSIKSYTFSGPGVSNTTTATAVTSSTISSSGTKTYTVTVTDNRGRTASKTATITCYAYSAPSIKLTAYRSNSNGTEDNSGTYAKCSYTLSFSSVNNSNDVTVKILYKKNSASSYSSTTVLTDSTSTSGSTILSSIAADSTYTIYATITDNYGGSSASTTNTVFGVARILNITSDGTGVAFGKMAESSELFESRYKIKAPGLTTNRGTRPADANIDTTDDYAGCLEYYLASNSMTSNKPSSGNGHILHFHWDDTTTGADSQLYLHYSDGLIQSRGQLKGEWSDWRTSLDSVNYTSYVSPKPTTLFSSNVGITGTVTLSSSAANFTYFEIFLYKDNTAGWWSVKVPSPDGKKVQVGTQYYANSSSVGLQLIGKTITISGTTITSNDEFYMNFNKSTGAVANFGTQNTIKIMRVLGYK